MLVNEADLRTAHPNPNPNPNPSPHQVARQQEAGRLAQEEVQRQQASDIGEM